jgi:tryptophanyl-tRNA synthetase
MEVALAPYRDKRDYYAHRPELITEILQNGKKRAEARAEATLQEVRKAMHL